MGGFFSAINKSLGRDKPEPIKNPAVRLQNIIFNNFRGIFGVIVPVAILSWQPSYGKHDTTVTCMWLWMFWFFLLHPIAVPCTAMIPIFLLPMAGVMSTMDTAKCYFNDTVALFILASMLSLLLNNSGFDRRFALWLMCSGDACQFSGKRLIYKCSTAAFILSMFSNRLIVTSTITQYVTPIFQNLMSSYGGSATEPNFDEMRYILNNAIQTSSAIGSIAILHASYGTLLFKAVWVDHGPEGKEYPDIFNYLHYSLYAFPVAFLMYVLNFCYHMLCVNFIVKKPMSAGTMGQVKSALLEEKRKLPPKPTVHEKLTVFFTIFALAIFISRWNAYINKGWSEYRQPTPTDSVNKEAPIIKDAVVAAIFVLALHILPRSLQFTQFITKTKRSQLKDVKPESAILWWRFVDQNTNYGYFFVFGGAIALNIACAKSTLATHIAAHMGKNITNHGWNTGIFLVCLLICILTNIMTGAGALTVFMPFVLHMSPGPEENPWGTNLYIAALAVGVGTSLGFAFPFLYTPAYFCHHVGKVPKLKMLKYSVASVIICMLILYASLLLWAPFLWGTPGPYVDSPGKTPTDDSSGGGGGGGEAPEGRI